MAQHESQGGRGRAYPWERHKEFIHQFYVVDRKPLDDLIEVLATEGFTPSKRSYQTQFKRWKFPLRWKPAAKDEEIIARVKEMWEENYTQKDMLKTLADEGKPISERDLFKVRHKCGLLMRDRNDTAYTKSVDAALGEDDDDEDEDDDAQDVVSQLRRAVAQGEKRLPIPRRRLAPPDLNAEQKAEIDRQRAESLAARKAHSDELWRTKKRRRRTRGWGGLGPDPEGMPPRFPSETTLDEAKSYLHLDNDAYKEVRDGFQTICVEEDIERKVSAGAEKWEAAKQRLIRESTHLQNVFWGPEVHQANDQRDISLDVICMDVTKRMRSMEKQMKLSEAKNLLRMNPDQSRKVRTLFTEIIEANSFDSKLTHGVDIWDNMKQTLKDQSDFLRPRFADGEADPENARKEQALEKICRDVMKRVRDYRRAEKPELKFHVKTTQGPGPAKSKTFADVPKRPGDATSPPVEVGPGGRPRKARATPAQAPYASVRSILQSSGIVSHGQQPQKAVTADQTPVSQAQSAQQALAQTYGSQMQIDPSLLIAANGLSHMPDQFDPSALQQDYSMQMSRMNAYQNPQAMQSTYNTRAQQQSQVLQQQQMRQQQQQQQFHQQHQQVQQSQPQTQAPAPIPCYFRLHPLSLLQNPPKLWLDVLRQGTVDEIRRLATKKHPGARLLKLEGIVKDLGESEIVYAIDEEVELAGYLAHVSGGKVTFVVRLG